MRKIAQFIADHSLAVVIAAVILFGVSIFGANKIVLVTEARQLLPENNPEVETFNRVSKEFATGNFIITVEGKDRSRMIAAADEIKNRITTSEELAELTEGVELKTDASFPAKWSLLLQEPSSIRQSLNLFQTSGFLSFFQTLNDSLENTYSGDQGQNELNTAREEIETAEYLSSLARAADILRYSIEEPDKLPENPSEELADLFLFGDLYNFDPTGTLLVFSITPSFGLPEIEKGTKLADGVRAIFTDVRKSYPELSFGYAGDIPQNADEQQAIGADLLWPTILALGLILLLFIFSFEHLRGVIFALIGLVFGIIITVGYIALTLGEINIFTSMFAVLLMGLGIDFGIHFVSNYDDFRSQGMNIREAITKTYAAVGIAVILGAITTAVSFFAFIFAKTEVIRQFALVAGGGILITMITMLTLVPALLALFGKKTSGRRLPVMNFRWVKKTGLGCAKRPWICIAAGAVVTAAAVFLIPVNHFIYDITQIGPQQALSVKTQRKIENKMGFSPYPTMGVYSDMETARKTTELLKEERQVAMVSSVTALIPPWIEQEERLEVIRSGRAGWEPADPQELHDDLLEDLTYEIQRLEWNIIEIGDLSVAALGEGNMVQKQRDRMIREIMGAQTGEPGQEVFQKLISAIAGTPERSVTALNDLQNGFYRTLNNRAQSMLSVRRKITPEDLPAEIRGQLISDDGKSYLVTAVPSSAVAEQEAMLRYRESIDGIDERMTGIASLSIELSEVITGDVLNATVYIGVALIILLLITFRKISLTTAIIISLAVSVAVMFGMFPIFGIEINVLNMMVLPLIFGLGVDYFIHITHRIREERDMGKALQFTGKAVVLSAATTMIAFGSLGLIGQYRAIQLLGQMLFVGIGIILIAALTLLPAILKLIKTN